MPPIIQSRSGGVTGSPAVSQLYCDRSEILESWRGHGIFFSFICLPVGVGHHQASKHARQQATQNPGSGNNAAGNGGGDTSR